VRAPLNSLRRWVANEFLFERRDREVGIEPLVIERDAPRVQRFYGLE
jgi:hypothetical protein